MTYNDKEIIVVKKNIITIIVPIVLLFPMSFFIVLISYGIFINEATLGMYWVGFLGLLFFVIPGTLALVQLFRFGNKKMIIDNAGITICNLKVQKILWTDIVDINCKSLAHIEFISININSGKKLEINLGDTQLNLSNDEIYTLLIERWYVANEQ